MKTLKKYLTHQKLHYKENAEECENLGHLQASRSEGSKRVGEILIDKKRYFLGCMDKKEWIQKSPKKNIRHDSLA